MLLYDRVLEAVTRCRRHGTAGPTELSFLQSLRRSAVFECSNVMPLMDGLKEGVENGISKRPPKDSVWMEWLDRTGGSVDSCGSLTVQVDRRYVDLVEPDAAAAAKLSELKPDEFYLSVTFRYCHSCEAPEQLMYWPLRHIIMARQRLLWCGAEDMTRVEGLVLGTKGHVDDGHQPSFGQYMITAVPVEDGTWGYDVYPWPALMAFALLHCRNVVTEDHEPDPNTQRRVLKTGNPPRTTYKTLKLEVPKVCVDRQRMGTAADDAGPKVRFHLCRGHFKNLQHERFKSKGWHWWPAHWKGSRSLGRVEKTYSLGSQEEVSQ